MSKFPMSSRFLFLVVIVVVVVVVESFTPSHPIHSSNTKHVKCNEQVKLYSMSSNHDIQNDNNNIGVDTRRKFFSQTATSMASLLTAVIIASPEIGWAAVGDNNNNNMKVFTDPKHGFSMSIPSTWIESKQILADRRELTLFKDPMDEQTALFIAYTPVRDDFTSLNSFGSVEQVGQQTILPKGSFAGSEVQSEMITAISQKQAYIFDYKQCVPDVQPPTHFRTIFTLVPGATGGAGSVLVTITAQTSEERYPSVKTMFDTMINSYDKIKV